MDLDGIESTLLFWDPGQIEIAQRSARTKIDRVYPKCSPRLADFTDTLRLI